jgi:hypothetical protein
MSTIEQQIDEVLLEPLPDELPPLERMIGGWYRPLQEHNPTPSDEWLRKRADNHRIRCAAHGLLLACELAMPCVSDPNVLSQLHAAVALARGPNPERNEP